MTMSFCKAQGSELIAYKIVVSGNSMHSTHADFVKSSKEVLRNINWALEL